MSRRLVNVTVALVISASLVAGAGLIYLQRLADQAGTAASMEALEAIRESERIAAEWGAEVGRVKNQPDADFDSLKSYIPRLAAQREAIIAARDRMGELPSEIRNGIRGYLSRLRAKQELIEHFKTDYAVVRNSQNFLLDDPEGGRALLASAREGGRTTIEDAARLMFEDLEQFIRTPDHGWNMRTDHTLDALLEASGGTPEAEKVKEIAAHVEVLLEHTERFEDRFEEAISNRKISNAAAALRARIGSHDQTRRISVAYLDYALYAVVGLALLYWVSLVVRFFRGRRKAEVPVAPGTAAAQEEAIPVPDPAVARAHPIPASPPPAEEVIRAAPAPAAPVMPDRPPAPAPAAPVMPDLPAAPVPVAPVPAALESVAGGGTMPAFPAEAPPADTGIGASAPVGPAPDPVREGGIDLTIQAMVEAVFGKLSEVAAELDRAAEAGEAFRSPGEAGEHSEEALAALLGRLAGARWNVRRLAAQARDVLDGEEAEPDWQRIDLRDTLTSLLDALDATHRARVTAVLLPGAVADVDRQAFEAAMERILGHALEAAARHPEGAGHVELTLTTHEGRHCISCIDHGPGPPASAPAGGTPSWIDTLDLDVARRLVTAQGGEFEATTYPPYGNRIRICVPALPRRTRAAQGGEFEAAAFPLYGSPEQHLRPSSRGGPGIEEPAS